MFAFHLIFQGGISMSKEDKVSAVVTEETFTSVIAAFDLISEKLPFLLELTTEQRKALPKFGDKSVAFVNKTLEFSKEHSEALPVSLDLEEFGRDVNLYNLLFTIDHKAKALSGKIRDTYLQAGAEAFATALSIYSNLKINKDLFEGSELVLDELSKRFIRKSKGNTSVADVA